MRRCGVIIVGAGPAGAATALALSAADPPLAGEIVVLEKSRHPRDKTCAGGVIPHALRLLDRLGVRFTVPYAPVDCAGVAVPDRRVTVSAPDVCRVVRRREFDAMLVGAVRARGVEVREEERVTGVAREGNGVRLETGRGTYWAPVVVGADGSGSAVRRALVGPSAGPVGRAVMCDVPVGETHWTGHAARRYDFDFTSCSRGLRGYRWAFPCLIDGVPHVNAGVYSLPPVDGARMKAELAAVLAGLGADGADRPWRAFPICTWGAKSRVAAERVLLAGDAAGCDPLMGEGISYALEYGMLAGGAIVEARATGDWSFVRHQRRVTRGRLGRKLGRLALGARLFYGPRGRWWFRLAAASSRAQAIGLAWYNGTDGWEERGALAALWTLAARRPL